MGLFATDYQVHARIFSNGKEIGTLRIQELIKGHLASWKEIADWLLYEAMRKYPSRDITEVRIDRACRLGFFPKELQIGVYSTTPNSYSEVPHGFV